MSWLRSHFFGQVSKSCRDLGDDDDGGGGDGDYDGDGDDGGHDYDDDVCDHWTQIENWILSIQTNSK